MCAPILSHYREGLDNFKKDDNIRSIAFSQGKGDMLNSEKKREEIRELRRKMVEDKQNREREMIMMQRQALASKAMKDQASAGKSQADAGKVRAEQGL